MRRFPIWLRVVLGIGTAALATLAYQERSNVFVTSLCILSAMLVCALAVFDVLPLLQRIDEAGWMRAYYYYGAIRREERRVALARALPPALLDRTCSTCSAPIQDGARFCYRCGVPVDAERFKFCYHCEKPVVYEAQYCPYCRFPVGEQMTNGMRLIGREPDALDKRPALQLVPHVEDAESGEHAAPPAWLIGFQPHMGLPTRKLDPSSSVWEELGVPLLEETAKHVAIGKDVKEDDKGRADGGDSELPVSSRNGTYSS